ncbi:hypothetical protein VTL71DRAFT_16348 [Oculimacula yallundae]|uniref:LPXTG-domain-containing protein n=1 Tax=Oculimacula yallundae TaxID=86028 RepID=A0ABR4CE80_9HELO
MRPSSLAPALVLITSFAAPTTALIASTSSPCAAQCGNSLSSTIGSDIVCTNADFNSTAAGSVYQNCVSCQIASTYVDPITRQSDLHWGIYNLRYALSTCLFGFPNKNSVGGTPCTTSTSCGSIQNAFEFDSLSLNSSSYGFCPSLPAATVPHCTQCLQVLTTEFYLTNFVVALDASCQQQPSPGTKLSIDGNLFSTTHVNITSPSGMPTSSYTPGNHGLTLGAKVGIAAGALCGILAIVGFCIVWQGKRRRRRYLMKHQQETGYSDWVKNAVHSPPQPTGSSPGGFFDSPQSQRPLVSASPWARREDESPASAMAEKVYFSPYSSQYNSPVDANDQIQTIGREWPIDRKGSVGGSSGVGGFPSRSRSREKRDRDRDMESIGDRIELQNVAPFQHAAPVLLHPGNGRGRALGDQDVRNGNVI